MNLNPILLGATQWQNRTTSASRCSQYKHTVWTCYCYGGSCTAFKRSQPPQLPLLSHCWSLLVSSSAALLIHWNLEPTKLASHTSRSDTHHTYQLCLEEWGRGTGLFLYLHNRDSNSKLQLAMNKKHFVLKSPLLHWQEDLYLHLLTRDWCNQVFTERTEKTKSVSIWVSAIQQHNHHWFDGHDNKGSFSVKLDRQQ